MFVEHFPCARGCPRLGALECCMSQPQSRKESLSSRQRAGEGEVEEKDDQGT